MIVVVILMTTYAPATDLAYGVEAVEIYRRGMESADRDITSEIVPGAVDGLGDIEFLGSALRFISRYLAAHALEQSRPVE